MADNNNDINQDKLQADQQPAGLNNPVETSTAIDPEAEYNAGYKAFLQRDYATAKHHLQLAAEVNSNWRVDSYLYLGANALNENIAIDHTQNSKKYHNNLIDAIGYFDKLVKAKLNSASTNYRNSQLNLLVTQLYQTPVPTAEPQSSKLKALEVELKFYTDNRTIVAAALNLFEKLNYTVNSSYLNLEKLDNHYYSNIERVTNSLNVEREAQQYQQFAADKQQKTEKLKEDFGKLKSTAEEHLARLERQLEGLQKNTCGKYYNYFYQKNTVTKINMLRVAIKNFDPNSSSYSQELTNLLRAMKYKRSHWAPELLGFRATSWDAVDKTLRARFIK